VAEGDARGERQRRADGAQDPGAPSKLLGLDAPIRIDIEHRIREMALQEGLDPDEAVEEARAIIKRLPR